MRNRCWALLATFVCAILLAGCEGSSAPTTADGNFDTPQHKEMLDQMKAQYEKGGNHKK